MAAHLRFQVCVYMMIFVAIVPFQLKLVQTFSSNVDYCSDPDTIIVSLPCSQRYLSESYFEKHDSLLDLDFQGFLEHELSLCSCDALPDSANYVPTISTLQRHLLGEGSHRHLSTLIKFSVQPEGTSEIPAHSCQAVVVERLPSGIFADPFELQHLVQRGVFIDAVVFGDTNLELPSALSNRSLVEVHMDVGQNIRLGNEKGFEINLDLPLHARYPPLDKSGYSGVEMGLPDIFMRCITTEKTQRNNCIWITEAEIADANTSHVVWSIPSGKNEHSGFVSSITFASALLSTLIIVLSAINSPRIHSTKDLKQP